MSKQEGSPNKVILTSSDGSGVNQLLFASPDLAGQQIQVLPFHINGFSPLGFLKSPLTKGRHFYLPDLCRGSFCFTIPNPFSWQFVTEASDQSGLVRPVVEYCVVCGDKASGRMFPLPLFITKHKQHSATLKMHIHFIRASLRRCQLRGL